MQKFPSIPDRIRLVHGAPGWVRDDSRFFITICCEDRRTNSLANDHAWESLLRTTIIYAEKRRWWPLIVLAMPDHLHAVVSIPVEGSLNKTVTDFKHATARFGDIRWQRDFFDHRIRNDESRSAKIDYVLQNPVRGGLVKNTEDWAYRFINR